LLLYSCTTPILKDQDLYSLSDWIPTGDDAGNAVRFALKPFVNPGESGRGQELPFDGDADVGQSHGVEFYASKLFRREHALVLLDGGVERVDGVEEHALVEGFVFEVFFVEVVFGGAKARGRGGVGVEGRARF